MSPEKNTVSPQGSYFLFFSVESFYFGLICMLPYSPIIFREREIQRNVVVFIIVRKSSLNTLVFINLITLLSTLKRYGVIYILLSLVSMEVLQILLSVQPPEWKLLSLLVEVGFIYHFLRVKCSS